MHELKLVSVNVERDRHWDTVLPFLSTESPDVVCMQELFLSDVPKVGYPFHHFVPNSQWVDSTHTKPETVGVCVFSRKPFSDIQSPYYWGDPSALPIFDDSSPETIRATWLRGIALVTIDTQFTIATTHGTWTPHGEAEAYQLEDIERLKHILADAGEHVLCGDFNIPRGKDPIANLLSQGYTDHIPPEYVGSMDMEFHRTRGTPEAGHVATNMVDYLLTTPAYGAEGVRFESGVSDHKAIVATITRLD